VECTIVCVVQTLWLLQATNRVVQGSFRWVPWIGSVGPTWSCGSTILIGGYIYVTVEICSQETRYAKTETVN